MIHRPSSIRSELFFGSVCGLGLSAAIWAVALAPPPTEPGCIAFLALAGLAGAVSLRLPFGSARLALAPAGVVAALLLYGLGASVLVAGLAVLLSGPVLRSAPGPAAGARATSFRLGATALAAFVGGAAFLAAGGRAGAAVDPALAAPLGLLALAWGATEVTVARLAARHETPVAGGHGVTPGLGDPLASALAGAALGPALALFYRQPNLRAWLLGAPLLYLAYVAGRWRAERPDVPFGSARSAHAHRNVARALARAIAARDPETERHLQRVQRLSVAVAEKLELDPADADAVACAALVHDVGTLAVPGPLWAKRDRLSAREAARVRTHPSLGAEMLARMDFPSPIRAIVMHHHERWDGCGYPAGLAGEAIPAGARILAAVTGYDAMVSRRAYRPALDIDEARREICGEAGSTYDPDVVDALLECLDEEALEAPSGQTGEAETRDAERRESAPAALPAADRALEALADIARASRAPLAPADRLALAVERLVALVPHRTCAIYLVDAEGAALHPAVARGPGAAAVARLEIRVGQRLSGWAAQHGRAVAGPTATAPLCREGNRFDFDGEISDDDGRELVSALVAPLVLGGHVLGTVTLYDLDGRAFSDAERQLLVHASGYLALAVGPCAAETAASSRLTDALTGLPSAKFLRLELARRLVEHGGDSPSGFGLLALRLRTLDELCQRAGIEHVERGVAVLAQRLAAACAEHECVVRAGHDLFLVVSPAVSEDRLVERWSRFVDAATVPPIQLGDGVPGLRVASACVRFGGDGEDVDALLRTLDERLSVAAAPGRTLVPFRAARGA